MQCKRKQKHTHKPKRTFHNFFFLPPPHPSSRLTQPRAGATKSKLAPRQYSLYVEQLEPPPRQCRARWCQLAATAARGEQNKGGGERKTKTQTSAAMQRNFHGAPPSWGFILALNVHCIEHCSTKMTQERDVAEEATKVAPGLVNNKYNSSGMILKAGRRKAAKSEAVICIDAPARTLTPQHQFRRSPVCRRPLLLTRMQPLQKPRTAQSKTYLLLPVLQHVLELGQLLVLVGLDALGLVSEAAGVVLLQPLDGLLLLLLHVLHLLVVLTLLRLRRGSASLQTTPFCTRTTE